MEFLNRFNYYKQRLSEYEATSKANDNKLPRSDVWRTMYLRDPYLIRASEDELYDRFCDVYSNTVEIDGLGRISPRPIMFNDNMLLRKFTHLLEETGSRGGIRTDLAEAGNRTLGKYFSSGPPVGIELFEGISTPEKPYFVKFSQREYIEKMFKFGEIRVSPASAYESGSLLFAMQDFETIRSYTIPTYDNLLKGFSSASIDGVNYDITNGDIQLSTEVPDYYLYSLCREIDRRMPTDFDSEAALIIKDRSQFQKKFFDALRSSLPPCEFLNGEVKYYDPYLDFKRYRAPEMTKHLRFHYQKEFRLVAKPKTQSANKLEPFFINIGSMEDFADICVLKN